MRPGYEVTPNLVIIQLLHSPNNPAEFLRLCWDKLSQKQKREIFYFLYSAAQYKTFLTLIRQELSLENPFIPWAHLISILLKNSSITENDVSVFTNSQVTPEELTRFRVRQAPLDGMWEEKKKTFILQFEQKKDELLKSLAFAKQQGLKEPRLKILKELQQKYAKDPTVISVLSQEKEFQARLTIDRLALKKEQTQDTRSTRSDETINSQTRESLLQQALEKIKTNSQLMIDFIVLFYQMELYDEALRLIDSSTSHSSKILWYDMIVSIDTARYVRALGTLQKLNSLPLEFADQSFSLMYYNAIILHGLGHKSEALQMMKNIVKIRPQFRSAMTLLNDWENEK